MERSFIDCDCNGVKYISCIKLIVEKYGFVIETSIKHVYPSEFLIGEFSKLKNMTCDNFIFRYPILNEDNANKKEIFKKAVSAFLTNQDICLITRTPATAISISVPTHYKMGFYPQNFVDTPYPVKVNLNNEDISYLFQFLDNHSPTKVKNAYQMMFDREFLRKKSETVCESDIIESVINQMKRVEESICAGSGEMQK